MTSTQALELEQLVDWLELTDAQVILMAREVSHSGTLLSLAELTRRDTAELILLLIEIDHKREVVRKVREFAECVA